MPSLRRENKRATSILTAKTGIAVVEAVHRSDRIAAGIDATVAKAWRDVVAYLDSIPPLLVGPEEVYSRIVKILRGLHPSLKAGVEGGLVRMAQWSHGKAKAAVVDAVPERFLRAVTLSEAESKPVKTLPGFLAFMGKRKKKKEPAMPASDLPDPADLLMPPPSEEDVDRFIKTVHKDGESWETRLSKLSKLASPEAMANVIAQGYAAGKSQREVAADLRPVLDGVASSARRVARTEGLRVNHEMQKETWKQADELIAGYQIHAVLDERTRPEHAARSGRKWMKTDEESMESALRMEGSSLPDAPNCRCWTSPILIVPEEFIEDPSKLAAFENDKEKVIPDPAVYSEWFATANEAQRRTAVGSKRYSLLSDKLGDALSWEHFIDPETGSLLAEPKLRNEKVKGRQERVEEVRKLIAQRKADLERTAAFGFLEPEEPVEEIVILPEPPKPKKPPKVKPPEPVAAAPVPVAIPPTPMTIDEFKSKLNKLIDKQADAMSELFAAKGKKAKAAAQAKLNALTAEESELKAKFGPLPVEPIAAPPAPIPLVFPLDADFEVKQVKKLGGSTGAVLVTTDKTGDKKFVLKEGASKDHIQSEVAADRLYEAMGVAVPKAKLYGGKQKLAEFVEGQSLKEFLADPKWSDAKKEAVKKKLQANFVADALIGNWDVIGLETDNVIVTPDGTPVRIDNGGSLRYRAKGTLKAKGAFGPDVTELDTMLDPKINPSAAKIFAGITKEEIDRQIFDVLSKRDKILKAAEDLEDVLAKRLDDLKSRLADPNDPAVKEAAKWKSVAEKTKTVDGVNLFGSTHAVKIASLPEKQIAAIREYSGSGYAPVNDNLRELVKVEKKTVIRKDELIPAVRTRIKSIDAVMKKTTIDQDVVTYRGVKSHPDFDNDDPKSMLGQTVNEASFVSSSLSEGVSEGFTGYSDKAMFLEYRVPAGTRGAYVAKKSLHPGELELLLDRGYTFRVVEVKSKRFLSRNVPHYVLELVPSLTPPKAVVENLQADLDTATER